MTDRVKCIECDNSDRSSWEVSRFLHVTGTAGNALLRRDVGANRRFFSRKQLV